MLKQQKKGLVLVGLGILLLACSLVLHLADQKQDDLAEKNAQVLLEQLELNRIPLSDTEQTSENRDMPTVEYMGFSMIGTLRMDAVGIKLPVLENWSYEQLNVAPCRYAGSVHDSMILMGHNYKSHFTPLHQAEIGMSVVFEDVNGQAYHYVVDAIEKLGKNQGEGLPSDHDLILFTCTPGGQNRLVIRCSRVQA